MSLPVPASGSQTDPLAAFAPWGSRPSIWGHVRAHLGPELALRPEGRALPDEPLYFGGDAVAGLFEAGALDGIFGGPEQGAMPRRTAKQVWKALRAAAARPDAPRVSHLYEILRDARALDILDPLLELVRGRSDARSFSPLARWLCEKAADREAVKIGLALTGVCGGQEAVDRCLVLGRHEEFTLFACAALAELLPDPYPAQWMLARATRGWGRIQAVRFLSGTTDPEICDWLLRQGYQNDVDLEHTALSCASAGGLVDALESDEVDRELLTACGEILESLVRSDPVELLGRIEDCPRLIERYLFHLEAGADEIPDVLRVHAVLDFLCSDEALRQLTRQPGWDLARKAELVTRCYAVLDRPYWRTLVFQALSSPCDDNYLEASRAAELLDMEVWSRRLRRLLTNPGKPEFWRELRRGARPGRVRILATLAMEHLPLEAIASGPALALGVGPAFAPHECLEEVLAALRGFPGCAQPVVRAALRSPVVRNRRRAIEVLESWGASRWEAETRAALARTAEADPDGLLRGHAGRALGDSPRARR